MEQEAEKDLVGLICKTYKVIQCYSKRSFITNLSFYFHLFREQIHLLLAKHNCDNDQRITNSVFFYLIQCDKIKRRMIPLFFLLVFLLHSNKIRKDEMLFDRRRQTDLHAIGDSFLIDDLLDQIPHLPSLPSSSFRREEYFYLIYLIFVSLFYIYYLFLLLFRNP
jgi:hypothetical protein